MEARQRRSCRRRGVHAATREELTAADASFLHPSTRSDCSNRFHAAPNRYRWRRDSDEVVVGVVCMLRPEKNLQLLMRAFSTLQPDLTARIAFMPLLTDTDGGATATKLSSAWCACCDQRRTYSC